MHFRKYEILNKLQLQNLPTSSPPETKKLKRAEFSDPSQACRSSLTITEQWQCGTRQGNTAVSQLLSQVCFQETKTVTRHRNTAATSVPLLWYQAAKHCSCFSAAGMVPGSETLQLHQRRCYGTRKGNTAVPAPMQLLCPTQQYQPHGLCLICHLSTIHCSRSSFLGRLYRIETTIRGFPI